MADDFTAGAGVGDRIEDVVRAEERRPKPKISTLRKSVIVLLALDNKYLKAPRSTEESCKIFWSPTLTRLNADEATRRVSERAILQDTHTHHSRYSTCEHRTLERRSNAGGSAPAPGEPTTCANARSQDLN